MHLSHIPTADSTPGFLRLDGWHGSWACGADDMPHGGVHRFFEAIELKLDDAIPNNLAQVLSELQAFT
jgi:hypothetical protein